MILEDSGGHPMKALESRMPFCEKSDSSHTCITEPSSTLLQAVNLNTVTPVRDEVTIEGVTS